MPRPAISPLDSCALRGGAFPYTGGKPQVVSEANDNFRKDDEVRWQFGVPLRVNLNN